MTIDEAHELFAYSAWANGRFFDAAEALTAAQAGATAESSFPSILGTLAHIVGAEWIWLRRWLGDAPTAAPAWVAASSLSELRAQLAAVESARDSYLARLSDGDLEHLTIDSWESKRNRDDMLTRSEAEYSRLDTACADWLESEAEVGLFDVRAQTSPPGVETDDAAG